MAIKILTDSTADLPKEFCRQEEIEVLPLTVIIDGKEYRDGVDLNPVQFYEMLASCEELPTTSQVAVGAFLEVFERYPEDEIIGIFLSSKLSGTYQSACIALEATGRQNIRLIDSGTVTFGLAMLVEQAAKLRKQGLSAEQIVAEIGALKTRLVLYAGIDTLKYLYKGGRLSGAGAVVGTLLQIKPVIQVVDGVIDVVKKARGNAAAYEWIAQRVREQGIDLSCRPYFGHTECPQLFSKLQGQIAPDYDPSQFGTCVVGVVVGTHAGPGCTGIAFLKKE